MAKLDRDTCYNSTEERFWSVIESYAKIESKLLTGFYLITTVNVSALTCVNFFIKINDTSLPYDFHIPGVSSYENWAFWCINYAFQMSVTTFAVIATFAYTSIMVLVMCHGCLKADTVIRTVESFGDIEDEAKTRLWIKSIAEESKDLLDYLNLANELIAPMTLTDTLILCSSVCLAIFSFSEEFSVVLFTILVVAVFQMYAYNFGGQQIRNKLDSLIFAVYDTQWYALNVKQRKDILYILCCLQKFGGYNSFFFELCHKTFDNVSIERKAERNKFGLNYETRVYLIYKGKVITL